jgi:hypothetical protein
LASSKLVCQAAFVWGETFSALPHMAVMCSDGNR